MTGQIFTALVVLVATAAAAVNGYPTDTDTRLNASYCGDGMVPGAEYRLYNTRKGSFRVYRCKSGLRMNIPRGVYFKCLFNSYSNVYEWRGVRRRQARYDIMTSDYIRCEEIRKCTEPPKLPNTVEKRLKRFQLNIQGVPDEYHVGDIVHYRCKTGYENIVNGDGDYDLYGDSLQEQNLTCNIDRKWIGKRSAQWLKCESIERCSMPPIISWTMSWKSLNRRSNTLLNEFRVGDIVEYQCLPGYFLNVEKDNYIESMYDDYYGPSNYDLGNIDLRLTCTEDRNWVGNMLEVQIRCERIERCSMPPKISWNMNWKRLNRMYNTPYEYRVGDIVEYECLPGYVLNVEKDNYIESMYDDYYGPSNYDLGNIDLRLTCNEDRNWVGNMLEVQIRCEPIICNATRIAKSLVNGRIINYREYLQYLDEMVLECDPGYKPIQGATSIFCFDSFSFDQELDTFGCEEILCPGLTDPLQGHVFYQQRTVGSNATFKCLHGQLIGRPVWTCQANGKWTGDCVVCAEKGNDCLPPCIGIGTVMTTYPYHLTIGSQLEFTCKGDFSIYDGKSQVRTCLKNGLWSKPDIDCTGQSRFSDVEEVVEDIGSLKESVRDSSVDECSPGAKRRPNGPCEASIRLGYDVSLLLDVSGSIKRNMFSNMIKFSQMLVRKLQGGHDPTKLSIYMFATKMTTLLFESTDIFQAIRTLEDVDRGQVVYRTGQGTAMAVALYELYRKIMNKPLYDFNKDAIIILSDGLYNMNGNPKRVADDIKATGAEIYAISIEHEGSFTDGQRILKSIATNKADEKHFFALNADTFDSIIESMMAFEQITCGKTDPRKTQLLNVNVADVTSKMFAWPWMVQITHEKDHICGGSVIERNWILTAAHCFFKNKKPRKSGIILNLNQHDRFQDSAYQVEIYVDPEDIFIHEMFDIKSGFAHDIALIRVKTMYFNPDKLLPVCLSDDSSLETVRLDHITKFGVVTGWGATLENGQPERYMKQMQMRIQTDENCVKNLNDRMRSKVNMTVMFCAGGLDTTSSRSRIVDTCKGDSGGPFVVKLPLEDRFVQIGIVSNGPGCKTAGKYGFYTSLNYEHLQWIKSTVKSKPYVAR